MKAFRPDPDERLNEVHLNYQQLSSLEYNSVSNTVKLEKVPLKAFPERSNQIVELLTEIISNAII